VLRGGPLGVPLGVPPPHDGVLLVALGVTGVIKKIWFLSFLFLYFCIFVFFIYASSLFLALV
jgi:hypothetical protein